MQISAAWLAACALLPLALGRAAIAQEIRGTVRDSATHAPVPGAVVTLLDAADAVLGRNLTNQRGEYRIAATTGASRLRVVRLGFRPRVLSLTVPSSGDVSVDITITAIPVTLESVRTLAGPSCPRRSDASAALALLEQARSGLLTTIVSRAVQPTRMKRLLFDRRMGDGDSITHQRVRIDSAVTASSFGAVRSASDFVKQGFMLDSAGVRTFFAPDAETLLDDGFTADYCFRIMDAERSRPHQIGLGFRPADGRRDRVDIDGALWIDTVARALIDVEFRYAGLDRAYEPYHPGGRVSFQAMPNGVVLVDRWMLRLVDAREDTATAMLQRLQSQRAVQRCPTRLCLRASVPRSYEIHEVGGELARAAWDDGSAWKGALGGLVVHAVRDEAKLGMRTVMKLADTEYLAVSDANGDLAFADLLPGPYDLVVVDSTLSPLGITLATGASLAAVRGSTRSVRTTVPSVMDFAAKVCGADETPSGNAWILGRVIAANGRPVEGARWVVQRSADGAGWVDVAPGGLTGADGTFHYCRLDLGMTVRVAAQFPGAAEASHAEALTKRLSIFALVMKPQ